MSWLITPSFYGYITDADAKDYLTRVHAAEGQTLEPAVALAVEAFVVGCKADGIWDAIKASCILAGARTLDGCLVPLVGAAPTNFNFVAGDYNRETGLVGDGSTKYLDSNTPHNVSPQNNAHVSVYASTIHTPGIKTYIEVSSGSTTNIGQDNTSSNPSTWVIQDIGSGVPRFAADSVNGFKGLSRANSTQFTRRNGSISTIVNRSASATAPGTGTFTIFSTGASSFSDARLAFYSIGEALDLALLDARVTALIAAIGAAIP